jgi:hypothetical protein
MNCNECERERNEHDNASVGHYKASSGGKAARA